MPFSVKVILVLLSVIILEIYFFKRVLLSLYSLFPKISKSKIRFIKWLLIAFINVYPIISIIDRIYRLSGNSFFSLPETLLYDIIVLYPFWVGTMIIVQTTLFFILFELISLGMIPVIKDKLKRKHIRSMGFFIIFSVFVIYSPIRIMYDYYSVEIREVVYQKEDLPNALDGFKIGFISDVQADRFTNENRLRNYIENLNSRNPDLVLLAGDIITNTPNFIEQSAELLGGIKSKYGAFTCVGDHDNWAYRGNILRSRNTITKALANVNIPMIDNDRLILGIDSANIEVTFITNTYSEQVNMETLENLTEINSSANIRIFLTHQPRQALINKALEKEYDMYLCGHTHGGQITFIFPFYNLSPTLFETTY
ncbi:MAG: metallophosphoesterase, partial [Melioribacteraceae bacterium]|nr:metallophosphoesterase [Melioribacteraceae bacterium]